MNVFQFFIICKRTDNANNATHYVKLGKKRRESSKRNYYIISPGVIIKAIIIKQIIITSVNLATWRRKRERAPEANVKQFERSKIRQQKGKHEWKETRKRAGGWQEGGEQPETSATSYGVSKTEEVQTGRQGQEIRNRHARCRKEFGKDTSKGGEDK